MQADEAILFDVDRKEYSCRSECPIADINKEVRNIFYTKESWFWNCGVQGD